MTALKRTDAPADKDAERIYEELMRTAARAGLVVNAYGGVATIAIPSEQRKAGLRQNVLDASLLKEPE